MKPTFQDVIMTLHRYWGEQGCVLWNPYNVQVGAGTGNPATMLRVLGPEPWRVAYVEPSIRPDDGRYAENPNRFQQHHQYQVILKPDPGNVQELYLASLEAIGIDLKKHDVRFVEDNWESPALGAWGLGWEVWLDGQEITQFTYFQQAGGLALDLVSVEITYGLERIVLALQQRDTAWEIEWTPGVTYADIFKRAEWEHSKYYFEVASVDSLRKVYETYERESQIALEAGLILPAYDYVLKCSHLFNVLDTRGAIGVTERASYFRRMRDMTRNVAKAYVTQRQAMEFPMSSNGGSWSVAAQLPPTARTADPAPAGDFLLEIGVEELPASDLTDSITHLKTSVPALFDSLKLSYESVEISGTPRRLIVVVKGMSGIQPDREEWVKGPAANIAFDANGAPTKAAEGFARKNNIPLDALQRREMDGGQYVSALIRTPGQPAIDVLSKALPDLIAGIKFGKSMRWNSTGVMFSRPLRWFVALIGNTVIPFEYAGVHSGRLTRGTRPAGSPTMDVSNLADYDAQLLAQGILHDPQVRQTRIWEDANALAAEVGGRLIPDQGLLDEVANLVEQPTVLRGKFDPKFLDLPLDVLVTVMRKHQRYFAVVDSNGTLLPYFITVRNGGKEHPEEVIHGNEHVLVARFTDAAFFFTDDRQHKLLDFMPRLKTLTFQEKLGSMADKNARLERLVTPFVELLGLTEADREVAQTAAPLLKADLGTRMVVEMTALAGIMGREYAVREGYSLPVAKTIFEHNLPRGAGDRLPTTAPGALFALADKLDSLVGLFGVGLAPNATADPYGLRRAASGVVQVVTDRALDLDLRDAIRLVAAVQPVPVDEVIQASVLTFIGGRLRAWLLDEMRLPFDVVEAVLAEQSHNPYKALRNAQQLAEWVTRPDWFTLLDGYARCVRITRKEATTYTINPATLDPVESQALYQATERVAQMLKGSDIHEFLSALQPIIPAITAFFDNVLVMDEDQSKRENRLALLQRVSGLARGYADLSKLNGF
jgi:glycyl-tRNA synthetase